MNFILTGILLFAAVLSFRTKGPHSAELTVGLVLQEQAKSVIGFFSLELEKARIDTKSLADLATHIFSHTESYRLSAQPGEYDYDEKIGIYGSLHNDGMSVAFLSALTPLTPTLLKEIRLSEYLNPVFQTLLSLNPAYGRVSLITVDSFQRSYPWFDFKEQIMGGRMKKDYQSSSLSIFVKANPANNPQHNAVWEVLAADAPERGNRISCAAPFFVGDQFHGVILTEINPAPLAKKIFLDSNFRDRQAFLLGSSDRILGMSPLLERAVVKDPAGGAPQFMKDLKFRYSLEIESILRRLPITEAYFGRLSGGYLQVTPLGTIPARLVAFLTPYEAERVSGGRPGGSLISRWHWTFWTTSAGGLLLLLNSFWILEHRRKKRNPSEDEMTVLRLSAVAPAGVLDEACPETGTESGHHQPPVLMDKLPTAAAEASPAETEAFQILTNQVRILSSFDTVGPIGFNLQRLCEILQEIFSVQRAVILIYSPGDRMFRALWGNPGVQGEVLEIRPLEIKAEEFLDFSADLREVHYSNAPLSLGCEESLIQIIKRNYMVSPLSFQEKLFGAVLLADKDADFSRADHNLLQALQVSVALTLRNFYQCEGLLKIDELRREYCIELSRAVETTLDRIREEVQAIYSRLGRTASPQKKNCEAILFEVGKLMEVVKEVREFEPEGELELPPTKAETLNNPNSEREPTR